LPEVRVQVLFWNVEDELKRGVRLEVEDGLPLSGVIAVLGEKYPRFAGEVDPGALIIAVDGLVQRDLRAPVPPGALVVLFPRLVGG